MKPYEDILQENQELRHKLSTRPDSSQSKVQPLLHSIDTLKKQLIKEKQLHKDNVRIKLIEKQKEGLRDQEKIIDALRKVINNDEIADKAILKMLNEGPKRVREPTKEDLKIEIKKLHKMIITQDFPKHSIEPLENGVNLLETINGKNSEINSLKMEISHIKIELTAKTQSLEQLQKQVAECKSSNA